MSMDVSTLGIVVESKGIKEASNSLGGLSTSAANAEKRVTKLTESLTKLMNVQASATGKATAQANAMAGNIDSTGVLISATQKLSAQMAILAEAFSNTDARARKSASSVGAHTIAMQDAHAAARGLAGGLGALWLTYGNIVPMVAGVALAKGFMEAAKSGAEFAFQLKFVQGLGEETAATMDKVSASILNMAKGSMFSPVEMASGMRVLSQAGLDAANALKVLPTAMDLAVVGEMNMEKASITLVGVMNAFKLSVSDIPHIGDVFAKAAAVSQTSVEQMTEAMKTASVVGAQYSVSMEEAATAITLLAKVNITGSQAGTSLKNMLKEMYAPGKQASDLMKNLGLSVAEANGELRPFAKVLFDLKDKLQQFDNISQTKILQRLFGERGSKEAIAMLSQTREEWDKLQSSIANSDGFMRNVSSMLEDTVKGKWIQAINTFKAQMIQTFESMAPQLSKMADNLQAMFADESFANGLKSILLGITSLLGVLVSLAPTLIMAAQAWLVYKSAMIGAAVWTGVSTAVMGVTASVLALSGAMGPTTTGMVGIRGVVAALPGLLTAIPTPLTVVAGLLAAGATAWFVWGENASRAGDKAFDSASRAEEILAKSRNRAKYGVGDIGDARQELDKAEKLLSLRIESRARGTALSDARASVGKWAEVVNSLEAEAQKATGATAAISKAAAGKSGGRKSDEVMGDPDKAAEKDAWRKELVIIQGQIDAAKRDFTRTEATLQSQEKAGAISKLDMISQIGSAEAKMYQGQIASYNLAIAKATTKANKTAVEAEYANKLAEANKGLENSYVKAAQNTAVALAEMEKATTQNKIDELKKRGEFVKAAEVENSETYAKAIAAEETTAKRLRDEIADAFDSGSPAVEGLIKELGIVEKHLDSIRKKSKTFLDDAGIHEANLKFKALFKELQADVESINERAVEGGGWLAKFASQSEIDDIINNRLPALTEALEKARVAAYATGASPEKKAEYNTELRNYERYIKAQGRVYREFIREVDQVGSEGFQALFSNVNGAWSSYLKKMKANFKSLLVDEIYKMFARPFVLQLVGNVAGLIGMNGLSAAATSAAAGGAASALSTAASGYSLYNARSTVAGWLGMGGSTSAGAAASIEAAELGSVMGNATGVEAALAPEAFSFSEAFAAIPGWGWALLGAAAIASFLDHSGTIHTGGAASASSSGVNAVDATSLGFMQINTSADAQKMVSGIATSIVGLLNTTATAFGETAGYTAATAFADDTSKDGAWGALLITKMGKTLVDWDSNRQSRWAPREFGDGAEGQQQYLNALSSSVRTALDSIGLPSWAQGMLDALGDAPSIESLAKTVDAINATQQAIVGMKASLVGFAGLTDTAVSALIKVSGGIDNLVNNAKAFYDGYYSEEEKVAATSKQVASALAAVGLEMPTTRKEFRALFESQLKLGESGAIAASTLLKVSGSFGIVADYAEKATEVAIARAKETAEKTIETVGKARDAVQAAYTRESDALKSVIDRLKDFSKTIRDFKDSLLVGSLSTLSPEQKYLELKNRFQSTSTLAASGDVNAMEQLQSVSEQFLEASQGYYASSQGYTDDFNLVRQALENSALSAETQTSIAQDELNGINSAVAGILNLNSTMQTLSQALQIYFAAGGVQGMPNGATVLPAGSSTPLAQGNPQTATEKLVEQMYTAYLGRASDAGGLAFWSNAINNGTAAGDVAWQIMNSPEAMLNGSHADGLDYVPFNNYRANLHQGERVQTASQARSSDEVADLMKEVLTELRAQTRQGGAAAEATVSRLEQVADKLDSTNRKLANSKAD